MILPKAEKAYVTYAWVIFFFLGAITSMIFLVAISLPNQLLGLQLDIPSQRLTGLTWSQLATSYPGISDLILLAVRSGMLLGLGFGILTVAISATGYRKGEMWAWWTMLCWPALILASGGIAPLYVGPVIGIPLVTLSLFGLFLPYRKFFPKKQSVQATSGVRL